MLAALCSCAAAVVDDGNAISLVGRPICSSPKVLDKLECRPNDGTEDVKSSSVGCLYKKINNVFSLPLVNAQNITDTSAAIFHWWSSSSYPYNSPVTQS